MYKAATSVNMSATASLRNVGVGGTAASSTGRHNLKEPLEKFQKRMNRVKLKVSQTNKQKTTTLYSSEFYCI